MLNPQRLLIFFWILLSWVKDILAVGSIALPLRKHKISRSLQKRGTSSIGLGDNFDIIYSVEVKIGSDSYPLVFDTGSSDVLVLTDGCTVQGCGLTKGVSLVPQNDLNFSNLSVHFEFGGATHSTAVNGEIASASVAVANAQITKQFLAAVYETDLPFGQEGLSGLIGAGFPAPFGSPIELELLEALLPPNAGPNDLSDAFFNTIETNAPFFTRIMLSGQFEQPMFTVTLERGTFEVGGNIGQLTLGGLPDGVSTDSLTWVPVRLYTPQQGGIPNPSFNTPNEIYPLRWEIPLDDVFINGNKLPHPPKADTVGYTALIDSGTTAILGPRGIVNTIYNTISPSHQGFSTPPRIPCDVPVELTFIIGGKPFPVDPRDFFLQQSSIEFCDASGLQPTDDPSPAALMSWILGAAFMRSNLVAFYFGNFTHPSKDPPRIGFLSTVPSNASQSFKSDINNASMSGGILPGTVITAPTGTFTPTATNFAGVAQQPTPVVGDPQGPVGVGRSRNGAIDCKGSFVQLLLLSGTSIIIQIFLISTH